MDYFKNNPSAERIAKYIFEGILEEMEELKVPLGQSSEPYLYAVDVFETETSRARYCIEV